MSAGRPPLDQLGITVVSHKNRYDGADKRRIYNWLVAHMTELGVSPTEMARMVASSDVVGRFRSFKHTRKRVEAMDFTELEILALRNLKPERDVSNWGYFDWSVYGSVEKEDPCSKDLDLWRASWEVYFTDINVSEETMLEHAIGFAQETVTSYGYIAYKDRRNLYYGTGFCHADGRAMWCDTYFRDHADRIVLRDIHYRNFLGRAYLDLEIEGTTLERWIEEHPQGGILTPFKDDVRMWAPPVVAIPKLREALYRAGHLLYYGFFDPSSPHFRDWNKPFVPREPIPDCFNEAMYAGTDPKMIR